ncbi:MAG: hypothetical protein WD876_02510 [Candidatus Pacearchaeota archaeon]
MGWAIRKQHYKRTLKIEPLPVGKLEELSGKIEKEVEDNGNLKGRIDIRWSTQDSFFMEYYFMDFVFKDHAILSETEPMELAIGNLRYCLPQCDVKHSEMVRTSVNPKIFSSSIGVYEKSKKLEGQI